jgi:hypothetical protein
MGFPSIVTAPLLLAGRGARRAGGHRGRVGRDDRDRRRAQFVAAAARLVLLRGPAMEEISGGRVSGL